MLMNNDDPLEELASENPDIRRMREQWALSELERRQHLARIRCLGPAETLVRSHRRK